MQNTLTWIWRLAPPILLLILAAGIILFPQQLSDLVGSISPGCTFRRLTGLACPGCGGTRALRALIEGEPLAAVCYNPFIVLSLPILCIEYFRSWWIYFRNSESPLTRSRIYCSILQVYAWLTILWAVGRNLL